MRHGAPCSVRRGISPLRLLTPAFEHCTSHPPVAVCLQVASGYPAMAEKYGPEYTQDNCTRALIFKRNGTQVSDVLSARALLRYNNYAFDPLAHDDPITGSVSSRGDLSTPKPVAFGGIDTKVVSLMASLGPSGDMHVIIESGPTHDQQPVFAWSNFTDFAGVTRSMLPDVYDFGTITVFLQE